MGSWCDFKKARLPWKLTWNYWGGHSAQKYLRKRLKFVNKLSIPAFLLALLFTGGLAWAQFGDMNRNEPEKPFLNPYSPANTYQSPDASQKTVKPNTKITGKTSIKPNNISKTPVSITPIHNPNYSLGKSEKMKSQPASTEKDAVGNSLSLGEYNQSGSSGSTSFLDGYFLKSLHEDKIVTKEAMDDNTTNNNAQKNKNRSSFIK